MKLNDIITELGMEAIPEEAEAIFASDGFDSQSTRYLSEDYMHKVDGRYSYFGEYADTAIANAMKIKEDAALLAMLNLAIEYFNAVDGDYEKIFKFPMPQRAKDKDALAMFSAVLLMTQIEPAEQRYVRLGFDKEIAKDTVLAFGSCFQRGTFVSGVVCMTELYRTWLYIYVAALIVNYSGYNFEVRRFSYNGVYLKNKTTGEVKALIYNEKIHRDGYILGSAGYTDEEDSYYGEFTETEDEYVGCVADSDAVVHRERVSFSKAEWEIMLKPGDDVIAFHIPKGADMSAENLDKVFAEGAKYIKECYPDRSIRCMTCGSWLLSPQLKRILKPDSKILAFGDRFIRFPMKDSGMAVFSFVFIGRFDSYNDLPENTSLERALKQLYLDGGYIHSFPGAFEIS